MGSDEASGGARRRAARRVRETAGGVGSASRQRIGLHLQAMYQRVLSQPVPDRFVDLIARLDSDSRLAQPEQAQPENDAEAPTEAQGEPESNR